MKTRRRFAFLCAALLGVALAYAGWWSVNKYQHRIIVVLPDGNPAPDPSVILDYDPVYTYHPTRLTGDQHGIVFIPRKQAYGRGWETMRIGASVGDRHYSAIRHPSDCKYPMTVVLEEMTPTPREGLLQQLGSLIQVAKEIVKEATK